MRINLFDNTGVKRGNKAILKEIGIELLNTLYLEDTSELTRYCNESNIVLCADFVLAGDCGNGKEGKDVVFLFYKPWKNDLIPLKPEEYPVKLPDRTTIFLKKMDNGSYVRGYETAPKIPNQNNKITLQTGVCQKSNNSALSTALSKIIYQKPLDAIFSEISQTSSNNRKVLNNREICIQYAEEFMERYGFDMPKIFEKMGSDESFVLFEDGSYPCIDGFSSVSSPLTANELSKKYIEMGNPSGMLFIYDDLLPLRKKYLEIQCGTNKFCLDINMDEYNNEPLRNIPAPSEDALEKLKDAINENIPRSIREERLKAVDRWYGILEASGTLSEFLMAVSVDTMKKLGLKYVLPVEQSKLYEPLFLPAIKKMEKDRPCINRITNESIDLMNCYNMKPFSKPIDNDRALLKEDGSPWRIPYTLARNSALGVNVAMSLLPVEETYFIASQAAENALSMNPPYVVITSFGSKYLNRAFDYYNIFEEKTLNKLSKRLNRQALPLIINETNEIKKYLLDGSISEDKTYVDKEWINKYEKQLCRDNGIDGSKLYQKASDAGFIYISQEYRPFQRVDELA